MTGDEFKTRFRSHEQFCLETKNMHRAQRYQCSSGN